MYPLCIPPAIIHGATVMCGVPGLSLQAAKVSYRKTFSVGERAGFQESWVLVLCVHEQATTLSGS